MNCRFLIPLLLLLLSVPTLLRAQEGIGGTTYMLAFPDTTANMFDARYPNLRHPEKAYICIYSAVANSVWITGPGGYNLTVPVAAGQLVTVDLMDSRARAADPIATISNVPRKQAFVVLSQQPVLVYCYLLTRFGSEAWTPLSVDHWEKEYFVAARPGEFVNDILQGGENDFRTRSKVAPAEITILAAYDSTDVTIVPNGTLNRSPSTTLRLNAGEVYQVQSDVDLSGQTVIHADLGGSHIVASKPIGVISGNTRALVSDSRRGLAQNSFRNMLVEWLTPAEQHGVEFVYLPTWDARRPTGAVGEMPTNMRAGEHVRIYGTRAGVTSGYWFDSSGARVEFGIAGSGGFHEDRITIPTARYYRTDKPVQAMMNSTAVIRKGERTQGDGAVIASQYDGWGVYMVELVPRSQWQSFSPFFVPAFPAGMQHYINVVTDSAHRNDIYYRDGSRFAFNRGAIPGTDLVWGTIALNGGQENHLEGRNGARFTGHVYGLYTGHEEYRPGSSRKEEDPDIQSGGDSDEPSVLHPSEYEEWLAVAYGYPLVAGRALPRSDGSVDSLEIGTTLGCDGFRIDITTKNARPAGIASITLENGSNARLLMVDRAPIISSTSMTILVGRIIGDVEATGTIMLEDRTGKITPVPFAIPAGNDSLAVSFPEQYFKLGQVDPDTTILRKMFVVNPYPRSVSIDSISLRRGNQGFSIIAIEGGALPFELAAMDSIAVTIQARPTLGNGAFNDTLLVYSGCLRRTRAMTIRTTAPAISVGDIDFGTFVGLGSVSTEMLTICNIGSGNLTFMEGPGGELISWINRQHFVVDPVDLAELRAVPLGNGVCIDLKVTFRGVSEGTFIDSARFFANDHERKSFSVWRAVVRRISDVDEQRAASSKVSVRPHPLNGIGSIGFSLDRPSTIRFVVVDAEGVEVDRIERSYPAGEQSLLWDTSALPAGIYFYRLLTDRSTASGPVVVVR